MATESVKREGSYLFGLPPRKRFKAFEQQKKDCGEEQDPENGANNDPRVGDPHCTDITNAMRVSPKKLLCKGFKVLEKQKHKQQQQQRRLQESLLRTMLMPPPPAAAKPREGPKPHVLTDRVKDRFGSVVLAKKEKENQKLKVQGRQECSIALAVSKYTGMLPKEAHESLSAGKAGKIPPGCGEALQETSAVKRRSRSLQKDEKKENMQRMKRKQQEVCAHNIMSTTEVTKVRLGAAERTEAIAAPRLVIKAQSKNIEKEGQRSKGPYTSCRTKGGAITREIVAPETKRIEVVKNSAFGSRNSAFSSMKLAFMDVVNAVEREETLSAEGAAKDGQQEVKGSMNQDTKESEDGSISATTMSIPMEEPKVEIVKENGMEELHFDSNDALAVNALQLLPSGQLLTLATTAVEGPFYSSQNGNNVFDQIQTVVAEAATVHMQEKHEQVQNCTQTPQSSYDPKSVGLSISSPSVDGSKDEIPVEEKQLQGLREASVTPPWKTTEELTMDHEAVVAKDNVSTERINQNQQESFSFFPASQPMTISPIEISENLSLTEEPIIACTTDVLESHVHDMNTTLPVMMETDEVDLCHKTEDDVKLCEQHQDQAGKMSVNAMTTVTEEVEKENEKVVVSVLSGLLGVKRAIGGMTLQSYNSQTLLAKRDRLLADFDERADKLFKCMFEREGLSDWNDQDEEAPLKIVQEKPTVDQVMKEVEVDMEEVPMPISAASEPSKETCIVQARETVDQVAENVEVETEDAPLPVLDVPEPTEEFCIAGVESNEEGDRGSLENCTDVQMLDENIMHKSTVNLETLVIGEERLDSPSAGQDIVQQDCAGSPVESPSPSGSERESDGEEEQSGALLCESSKQDSDWDEDLESEVPDFTFGKRSGITQRVKAPGWHVQISKSDATDNASEEEEDACDVCQSSDADPSDPIVFCDGCDVAVHANCYGNPLRLSVPEGDWFCAQCLSKSAESRNCCLCPATEGAMKQTIDGKWAHISCAVFVPEVFFRSADEREPIDISHVPHRRWESLCSVCNSTGGACVDCTERACQSSFHVSCALKKDLAMEYRNGRSGAIVISFCEAHTARWNQQQESRERTKFKIVSREPRETKGQKFKV